MKYSWDCNKLLICILLIAPIILLILVFRSPSRLIYDENFFVGNISLLDKYGFSIKFLKGLYNQSPGPLYQLIYYPLKYVGIKTIREYRIINLFLLYGVIYILYRLIKIENYKNPIIKALLLFAIPLTWTTGGLALTEIPTLFFALLSLLVLRSSVYKPGKNIILLSISGILLGISILGRTPFLMIIPAVLFYFFIQANKKNKLSYLLYFVLASFFPVALFFTWNGLVPPNVQKIQSGINFLYLGFTLSYTCFFLLLIYPSWYNISKVYYKIIGILFLILILLNVTIFHIEYMPMKSLNRILPVDKIAVYEHYFSLVMPCIMICFSLLHIVALCNWVIRSKDDHWEVFLLVASTLIAFTTIKSAAQFSTRYPYQGFPILMIYCAKYINITPGLIIRVCVGIIIGIISITGYYHIA